MLILLIDDFEDICEDTHIIDLQLLSHIFCKT